MLANNAMKVDEVDGAGDSLPSVPESMPLPDRMRVETVLTRMPVHRLSKHGPISISLRDLDPKGTVRLLWEVSYNSKWGHPGPLAYKVEALLINRRIDQASTPNPEGGRHIPSVIRIGSLTECCRDLGVTATGPNRKLLLRALQQATTAAIECRFEFTNAKGETDYAKGTGSRWRLVEIGATLPSGQRAETLYLELSPWYLRILQAAPIRPVDHRYMRELTQPIAQRFYELASFLIFGVLANDRPRAKMLYSYFCTYAPQARYFTFDQVKKQMHKALKQHRESGYILKVEYQQTTDGDGQADWEMYFTVGPRARAEYLHFTSPQRNSVPGIGPTTPVPRPRRKKPLDDQPSLLLTEESPSHLAELLQRGVAETKARDILASLKPDQDVTEQLEWFDHRITTAKAGRIENAPGLLIRLLEQNTAPPASFPSSRKRRQNDEGRQAKQAERARQEELKAAYGQYRDDEAERYVAGLPHEEYEERFAAARRMLRVSLRRTPDDEIDRIAHHAVRSELRDSGIMAVLSFEEFCARRSN